MLVRPGSLLSHRALAVAAPVVLSDAETLAGSETDALAIVYTDDHFKATTGFNGSVYCVDSGTPANDYSNSPTTEAASYFTYTAPDPKMILHDDGVLKYNAHNLVTYSKGFGADWSDTGSATGTEDATTDSQGESTATRFNGNSTDVWRYSGLSLVTGATYRMIAELKAGTGNNWGMLQHRESATGVKYWFDLDNGVIGSKTGSGTHSITSLGNGWYKCEILFVHDGSGTPLFDILGTTADSGTTSAVGGTLFLSRIHVHRYPADTTYLRTTSASRFADPIEFNSSGTALGALVEPQRTNLFLQSNNLDTTSAVNRLTVSAAGTGADGLTGWLLTEDNTAGTHSLYQSITSSTATHTASAIIEPSGRTHATISVLNLTAENFFCATFSLSGSGSVTQTDVGTSSGVVSDSGIELLPDGRYLCWVTGSTSAGIQRVDICTNTTGTPTNDNYGRESFAGNNSAALYVGHVQLEIGSSVTSRIRTYGSTVTRAADNISKATSAFPFDGDTLTLYGRGAVADTGARIVAFDFVSRAAEIGTTSGAGYIYSEGGAEDSTVGTNSSDLQIAFAIASNDAAWVADGGTVETDNTITVGFAPTNLHIGSLNGSSSFAAGHIKAILYVPRRVSNADMQTLTSTGALP